MKLSLCFVVAAAIASAASPELAGVKTVYMLPMSAGLDQYLAVRLTSGSVFQVVTDPQKADAVFTDRIGASLEESMHDLFDPKKVETDKNGKAIETDDSRPVMAPLSRGKGSIFLVDRKTRAVIWSMYARSKTQQPDDMNHLARDITNQLSKDLKTK